MSLLTAPRFVTLFILGQTVFWGASQPCTTQDFGIAYNGDKVFTVTSNNKTCMCSNYASSGLATFASAVIPSLTVNTLTAPGGLGSSLQINGSAFFDGPVVASAGIAGSGVTPNRQVHISDNLDVGSLVTIDGAYQCGGLRGFYYQNTALEEPAACTQPDAALSFSWVGSGPCNPCAGGSMSCTGWSARWSGYLKAPVTANVSLSFTVDDGVRVWWDNQAQPLLATWSAQNVTIVTAVVNVVQGRHYALRVEYMQVAFAYQLLMQWFWPGQGIVAVPSANLCAAGGIQVAAGTSTFNGQVAFNAPVLFGAGIGSPATATKLLSPLAVDGWATFSSGLSVAGGQTVDVATAGAAGSVTLGASGVPTTLRVFGTATFNGGVSVPTGTVVVSGLTQLNGLTVVGTTNLDVVKSGSHSINGTLSVSSTATFSGSLSVAAGGSFASLSVGTSGVTFGDSTTQVTAFVPANQQRRVSGACSNNTYMQSVNADGTVVCAAVANTGGGVGASCAASANCASGLVCEFYTCVADFVTDGSLTCYLDAGKLSSYPGYGTTWYDLSGRNNHGALSAHSFIGGAMQFGGGSSSQVVLPTASALGMVSSSFTIEMMILFYSIVGGVDTPVFCSFNGPFAGNTYAHFVIRGGVFYEGFYGNDMGGIQAVQTNRIYYVAYRYDASIGEQSIYVNGVRDNSQTGHGAYLGTSQMQMAACWQGSVPYYLNGRIYTLRTYNRALSGAEMLQNYQVASRRFSYPVSTY